MQFSKAHCRAMFLWSATSVELDASTENCMHLRKCFIRSVIAPIIAREVCCFALCASCVVTLTISVCIRGCLTTFLWSKCLTKIDNKRCDFSPGLKITRGKTKKISVTMEEKSYFTIICFIEKIYDSGVQKEPDSSNSDCIYINTENASPFSEDQ